MLFFHGISFEELCTIIPEMLRYKIKRRAKRSRNWKYLLMQLKALAVFKDPKYFNIIKVSIKSSIQILFKLLRKCNKYIIFSVEAKEHVSRYI